MMYRFEITQGRRAMEQNYSMVVYGKSSGGVFGEQYQNWVSLREEFALITRARSGDVAAKELITRRHLGFVKEIASRLYLRGVCLHYEYDDLVQDGCLGLFDAMERYQVVNGASFKTFASRRILGSMIDAIRKNSNRNRRLTSKMCKMEKVRDDLSQKLLRLPTLREWREALPKKMQKEFEVLRAEVYFASKLRSPLSDEFKEEAFPGEYFLNDGITPESISISREYIGESENFRHILSSVCEKIFDERERKILTLRYPESETMPLNQIEVGQIIGVTGSRVCQIEKKMLAKLRRHLHARYYSEVVKLLEGMASIE